MYNLADNKYRTQIFTENGAWKKPEGCVMVMIIACGAGGGGGGGSIVTSNFRGSSGGGSGAITKVLVPAMFLPDDLIITVGKGGPGGVTASQGTAGGNTAVHISSSTISPLTASNLIVFAAGGSAGERGQSGGTGGIAGGVSVILTNNNFASIGQFLSNANDAGGSATISGAGINYTISSSTGILYSSTAGGGRDGTPQGFNGGDIIGISGIIGNISGGTGISSGTAGNGSNGYTIFNPIISVGGTGGGGSGNGAGGNGGDGGNGTGGGGGGVGTTVGGTGGTGGNGFVIITCW